MKEANWVRYQCGGSGKNPVRLGSTHGPERSSCCGQNGPRSGAGHPTLHEDLQAPSGAISLTDHGESAPALINQQFVLEVSAEKAGCIENYGNKIAANVIQILDDHLFLILPFTGSFVDAECAQQFVFVGH